MPAGDETVWADAVGEPVTLTDLVEMYRDLHLLGRASAAADTMAEIDRRLTMTHQFQGTEARRIRAILTTGKDPGPFARSVVDPHGR